MANCLLWNKDWEFMRLEMDQAEMMELDPDNWKKVTLPHDWLIYDTKNLYEDGVGWYRKQFHYEPDGELFVVRFDGVYMDCTVYVNGQEIGQWKYGYSTFEFDLTQYLNQGENEIRVKVMFRSPNSRWYSGAGIYRNVWLKRMKPTHLISDGIYITPVCHGSEWSVITDTEIWQEIQEDATENKNQENTSVSELGADSLRQEILGLSGEEIASNIISLKGATTYQLDQSETICQTAAQTITQSGMQKVTQQMEVKDPNLWDIAQGNLYYLKTELLKENQVIDVQVQRFGFRTIVMDPQQGLFLNDRKIKLHGVCEHHDLGCLGAEFNKTAMRRKFEILRKMGVNAVRTSHNMPAPEVMELADEMGFLIDAEAFDMWERSKTTYDYARFFDEWMEKDVASWIRRDRNHASVLMWSIGNEIYDTHADERGAEVTRMLKAEVEKHDFRHHAPATIGSNYMRWENAQKCADIVKVAGYNYGENLYSAHHEQYPDWIIYGSETSSVLASRNIYHFPLEHQILCDDDEQCSALGNCGAGWGAKSCEDNIIADRDADYSLGQFVWSGFDYFGEPTPYNTRNCYFGQIDTAGFAKDSFYIYQAEWTDYKENPMIHIFPYWDFNEGQQIDVRVCSNAPKVELFVNGESQGTFTIDHLHGKELVANWKVPYTTGELYAKAYDERDNVIAEERRHSFGDTNEIRLIPDKTTIAADGEDLIFVEIRAYDANGYPVENAKDRIQIEVTGAGHLIGIDNGDSTDYDQVRGNSKRLFGGRLLAIITGDQFAGEDSKSGQSAGEIVTDRIPESADQIASERVKELESSFDEMKSEKSQIHMRVTTPGMSAAEATFFITNSQQEANTKLFEKNKEDIRVKENQSDSQLHGEDRTDSKIQDSGSHCHEIPIRKIELVCEEELKIYPGQEKLKVQAKCYPTNATYSDLEWKAITITGIATNLASVESEGDEAIITGLGDGSFILRCTAKNGGTVVSVQSNIAVTIEGIGQAVIDPYESICAGLCQGRTENISEGVDHGIRFCAKEKTAIRFESLDFGKYGTDEMTLEIFKYGKEPVIFEIWEGIPGQDKSELLATESFDQSAEWMQFKPHTVTFRRKVKGVTTISVATSDNFQLKNLWFKKYDYALQQLLATENDGIYGDDFTISQDAITEIGNNVTLCYDEMDFGEEGVSKVILTGQSSLANNSIHLRIEGEGDEQERIELIEFAGSETYVAREYTFERIYGKKNVHFVFLPGSQFDFECFQFVR